MSSAFLNFFGKSLKFILFANILINVNEVFSLICQGKGLKKRNIHYIREKLIYLFCTLNTVLKTAV